MKKLLLLAFCASSIWGSYAQKKIMIYDGEPFSPAVMDASAMRFSNSEGKYFPTLPDEIYISNKILIFNITDVSEDCSMKVMNAWWSNIYRDYVDMYSEVKNDKWTLKLTDQIAKDCAQCYGARDLDLMLSSGSMTVNSVCTFDDNLSWAGRRGDFTEVLDSIVTPGQTKEVFTHDENGQRSSMVGYSWNSSQNEWQFSYKSIYSYEEKDNEQLVSYDYYNWDIDNNAWVLSMRGEQRFDADGNLVSNACFDWDSSNSEWVGSYKFDNAYDANGKTLGIDYIWADERKDWIESQKTESLYDSAGRLLLDASYFWDNAHCEWIPISRLENSFTSDGDLTYECRLEYDTLGNPSWGTKSETDFNEYGYRSGWIYSEWSRNTNDWVIRYMSKSEYTYDANGKATLYYDYNCVNGFQDWVLYLKVEHVYDSNGNLISIIGDKWHSDLQQWLPENKQEYKYDQAGNCTLSAIYYWDDISDGWMGSFYEESIYDSANRIVSSIESFRWDFELDTWQEIYRNEFTYDADGNTIAVIGSYKEKANEPWRYSGKREYAYDTCKNQIFNAEYVWIGDSWDIRSLKEFVYDTSVSCANIREINSAYKILSERTATFGYKPKDKTLFYYYSPLALSGIRELKNPSAGTKGIYNLHGQPAFRMIPGQIYLRGNEKIKVR